MPPPPVRRVLSAVAALVGLSTGALAGGAAPAEAAVVGSASCVDGGGVRWQVEVTWGAVYAAAGGVRRVSLDRAAWTTAAGPTATDSRVRTYDGAGTRLQDLSWSGPFDYRSGAAWKARNPVNPPSAPGGARVVVTLGVDGDGFGSCSVTLTQPVPTSVTAAERYEADIAAATNAERTSRGLVALRPQACVDSYAAAQARRMAAEQRMYHQELGPVLAACQLRAVGENVAAGYATGEAVTVAWMASPGHRANILGATSTVLGVGAAQGPDGRWYATQVFGTPA